MTQPQPGSPHCRQTTGHRGVFPSKDHETHRREQVRHVMPGYALDLKTVDPADGLPWDFSKRHKRIRARKLIRQQRPYLVIGSPQCKEFCTWQRLNEARHPDDGQRVAAREAAEVHPHFVFQLYQGHIDGGR